MIYAGTNVTHVDDKLTKVTLDYLYHAIKEPKADMQAKLRQLRIVRSLDPKRYAACKRELPYLVCGCFHPPVRNKEYFVYTEYFFVDIDHIEEKGLSMNELRRTIEADPRVVMSFVSPSNDGLKVLFRLKEKCHDSGIYSAFYKQFVRDFSLQYALEQVVDGRTSDVSRACFFSHDPMVYYNKDAEGVDVNQYVDTVNNSLFGKEETVVPKKEKTSAEVVVKTDKEPDADAISNIKQILKLKSAPQPAKNVFVPEQLNEIIDGLIAYVEDAGLKVTEIININYGKKIRAVVGMKQAEINLFYGKRGFSVVISPRCGTDMELNELAAKLITTYFLQ